MSQRTECGMGSRKDNDVSGGKNVAPCIPKWSNLEFCMPIEVGHIASQHGGV
jgi:hypothetical protein